MPQASRQRHCRILGSGARRTWLVDFMHGAQGAFGLCRQTGSRILPTTKADGFLSAIIYLTMISTNQNNLEACISQAEAARIRGVSRQAIADLVRRGRLAKVN